MAVPWNCFENATIDPGQDVATIRCLEPVFQNIVTALIALAGVVLFLILIASGFNYLFAGSDMKKLEKARGGISGAVIGLVVIVAAYLIIGLIAEFTGVTGLTIFRIIIQP